MPEIIQLVCPTCGGKCDAPETTLQVTCAYCGNQFQVYHEAGAMAVLQESNIKTRTASEQAIQRMEKELDGLNARRKSLEKDWETARQYHEHPTNFRRNKRIGWISTIGGVGFFIVMVAIIYAVTSQTNTPNTALACTSMLGPVAVVVGLVMLFVASNQSKQHQTMEDQYQNLRGDIADLDEKIAWRKQELEKHQKILGAK